MRGHGKLKRTGEEDAKVTLVSSLIGTKPEHRASVRGLGLKRLNQTVEVHDTPAMRGMINAFSTW